MPSFSFLLDLTVRSVPSLNIYAVYWFGLCVTYPLLKAANWALLTPHLVAANIMTNALTVGGGVGGGVLATLHFES